MSLTSVLEEIRAEREYQDQKWGVEFDDHNTVNDWVTYINHWAAAAAFQDTQDRSRLFFLKAAAIAIAAIESYDRNRAFPLRHYDEQESENAATTEA